MWYSNGCRFTVSRIVRSPNSELDDIHLNAFKTPEMGHELARFTRRVQLLHAPKFATGPDCVASAGDSRVSKCGMSSGFCSYAYCKAQHYPSI